MKKRLVLVLASITLIIGCAYILTGKVIQKNYFRTIAQFNSQQNIQVRLIDYSRGLFHSYAKLEVVAPSDNSTAKPSTIVLQQTLTHGPIIAINTPDGVRIKFVSSQIVTTLADMWQQNLIDYTNNPNPLIVKTVVSFFGEATTWLSVAAVDQNTPSNFNIAWSALTGEMTHDLNFVNYEGKINWPAIKISTADTVFNAADLTMTLTANKQPEYTSTNIVRIKNISYSKNHGSAMNLDDITMRVQLEVNASKKLQLELVTNIGESQILQQKFAQNNMKIQLINIEPSTLLNLSGAHGSGLKSTIDFLQKVSSPADAKLAIELPKHFTESFLSYLSYEIYRSSMLGKIDKREDGLVLRDITASINRLVSSALKNKIFVEQGAYYALNFDSKIAQG